MTTVIQLSGIGQAKMRKSESTTI